jgi:PKD repeat protein
MDNYDSRPSMTDVIFSDNYAGEDGGGMNNYKSNPTLTNVGFDNNSASYNGGGMLNDQNSNPIMHNVNFFSNFANDGGGMLSDHNSNPSLTNVTFDNNIASRGGGMSNYRSSPLLNKVTFVNNHADAGGGMYNYEGNPSLTNVTFSTNTAHYGGGLMNATGSGPILTNVTCTDNSADFSGGALFNDASSSSIINTILWGNLPNEIEKTNGGTAAITYSVVQGGYSGTGNIIADPKLGGLADNGGLTWTHALQAGSPAIDAGNPDPSTCPATDQRGVSRPQGVGCDIGAYEFEITNTITADFSGSPTSGVAPLQVTFTNLSSGDYDTCNWDFGDGETSNVCVDPMHVYNTPGVYTVELTVSGLGGTDTQTRIDYIGVYKPVQADFSASPTSGVAPLQVTFTNLSSGDYDSCAWDFGDGGSSDLCDPSPYTYTTPGVFTISLTVTGLGGFYNKTYNNYITVQDVPPVGSSIFLPLIFR